MEDIKVALLGNNRAYLQIVAGIISSRGFWPIDTAIANEIS